MKNSNNWSKLAASLLLTLTFAAHVQAAPADIVIGAPNSLTGGGGESGRDVVSGLQMAVDDINRAGGIKALGGAHLKLIPADTTSDNPQQAASVTRRLITQDHAVVLVGSHISTMTLTTQIEAERASVPIITTSFSDQIVQRGYKYTFKIPSQISLFASATLDYMHDMAIDAKKPPPKRIAIFTGSDAASVFIGKFWQDLAKQRGLEVVASGSFPSGLTDPTPVVAPILRTKPDVLFSTGYPNDIILIVHALRALKVNIPVVGSGSPITAATIPQALGKDADGIMGTVVWNGDLPFPGVKEFQQRYLKAHPDKTFVTQEAGEGYAIGELIGQALERTTAPATPQKIHDSLATIHAPSFLPGGAISFDASGLNQNIMPIMVQWHNGTLHTIWPKQYQTEAPILR